MLTQRHFCEAVKTQAVSRHGEAQARKELPEILLFGYYIISSIKSQQKDKINFVCKKNADEENVGKPFAKGSPNPAKTFGTKGKDAPPCRKTKRRDRYKSFARLFKGGMVKDAGNGRELFSKSSRHPQKLLEQKEKMRRRAARQNGETATKVSPAFSKAAWSRTRGTVGNFLKKVPDTLKNFWNKGKRCAAVPQDKTARPI